MKCNVSRPRALRLIRDERREAHRAASPLEQSPQSSCAAGSRIRTISTEPALLHRLNSRFGRLTDISPVQNRVAHDQHVHPGAQEASERLTRLAHHGLILVE